MARKKRDSNLQLIDLKPLTSNQSKFFETYDENCHEVISLTGWAGTGKSLLALYKALQSVEADNEHGYKCYYDHVLILRSIVPSRDIGFLPGDKNEKIEAFESPYYSLCTKLYGRSDAYSILKQKGMIKFESTSFLRGETFTNCIVIIDEAQNLSKMELYTILTRIGEGCRVLICGDAAQDDLTSERFKEYSGFSDILNVLEDIRRAARIEFGITDIVRSEFVRDFIIAYNR